MTAVVIGQPIVTSEPDTSTLSAPVRIGETGHRMWFRFPAAFPLRAHADPFVIALRITAMKLGLPLRSETPVSARLLAQLPLLDEIHHCWYPELAVTPVEADAAVSPFSSEPRAIASFFSGGLDAFYTAIKNRDRVGLLVLVHGFDFERANLEYRAKVSTALSDAARLLGKRLVEVETNCREITEPFAAWGYMQHGPALAAVASAMDRAIERILIPASATYRYLAAHGSHPLTDPLWGTERLAVEHDGMEATRNRKAAFIAGNEAAMKHLRVCWRNPGNAYNCGRCEKCVRTMITLLTVGALDRCQTFPTRLTPELIRGMEIVADIALTFTEENLAELKAAGGHPDLCAALEEVVHRHTSARLARQWSAMPPLPTDLPELADAVFRQRGSLLDMIASRNRLILLADALRAAIRRHPGGRRG